MNLRSLWKLLALSMLAALFLVACQSLALETTNPPDEPAGATEMAVPDEPTRTVAQVTPTSEGSAPSSPEIRIPEGWQVLDEVRQGYVLAFPQEWNACQETRYSWTFCDIQEDSEWVGSPPRLYVSVFPNDYTNEDWEVYNFIPTVTIRKFITLSVGESKAKEPGAPRTEYITYTRLANQTVAGLTAAVIENSQLWGIPSGTKERVVLIITEDTTYIIGMYYATPEQLTLFEQVLDTFQFYRPLSGGLQR
jgi:hypothetical protein